MTFDLISDILGSIVKECKPCSVLKGYQKLNFL